jgi:hypothetical protein
MVDNHLPHRLSIRRQFGLESRKRSEIGNRRKGGILRAPGRLRGTTGTSSTEHQSKGHGERTTERTIAVDRANAPAAYRAGDQRPQLIVARDAMLHSDRCVTPQGAKGVRH